MDETFQDRLFALLDHFVVTGDQVYSFAEHGQL